MLSAGGRSEAQLGPLGGVRGEDCLAENRFFDATGTLAEETGPPKFRKALSSRTVCKKTASRTKPVSGEDRHESRFSYGWGVFGKTLLTVLCFLLFLWSLCSSVILSDVPPRKTSVWADRRVTSVSYTHLTLPTICSV